MSRRSLDNPKRTGDPLIDCAVTKALDIMADVLPELLSLPDSVMVSLEESMEISLTRALAGQYHRKPEKLHSKTPTIPVP